MSEKKKDDNSLKDIIIGVCLFIAVTAVWYYAWGYIDSNVFASDTSTISDEEARGVFGDKFGAINALFSSLAFAGIIFTIFLQKRELKLQREELEETKFEFIKQNETLKKQRFENTFFQLIALHSEIVENLKIQAVDGETYEKREFFIGAIKDLKYRSKYGYFKYSALTKLEVDEITAFKADSTRDHSFFEKLEKEEIENLRKLSPKDIENFISEPIDDKETIFRKEYENFFH